MIFTIFPYMLPDFGSKTCVIYRLVSLNKETLQM